MRRRDFIKAISVWTAWPLAAHSQPRAQKRRVAVLMGGLFSNDWGGQAKVAAFETGLTELGWKLGTNIELEYRWPGAELDQVGIAANEIVAMRPDLVVSRSTPTTAIMRPVLPFCARCEKNSSGLQEVQVPKSEMFRAKRPASNNCRRFAWARSRKICRGRSLCPGARAVRNNRGYRSWISLRSLVSRNN